MANEVNINYTFDIDKLKHIIENSKNLNNNEELFFHLAEVARAKKQIDDIKDLLISVDQEAKSLINSKAKALYGSDWQAIKGEGYKITKSFTGSIYSIVDKPNKKFLVIKESVNSSAVDDYVEENEKLPKGIDFNPQRGESIRVVVKDENN